MYDSGPSINALSKNPNLRRVQTTKRTLGGNGIFQLRFQLFDSRLKSHNSFGIGYAQMPLDMVLIRHKLEVLDSIVLTISVQVMNTLVLGQTTAKVLRHNQSVFIDPPVSFCHRKERGIPRKTYALVAIPIIIPFASCPFSFVSLVVLTGATETNCGLRPVFSLKIWSPSRLLALLTSGPYECRTFGLFADFTTETNLVWGRLVVVRKTGEGVAYNFTNPVVVIAATTSRISRLKIASTAGNSRTTITTALP